MANGTIIFACMDLPPTKPARQEKDSKCHQNKCQLLGIRLYNNNLLRFDK
jgi:hypothetical protein